MPRPCCAQAAPSCAPQRPWCSFPNLRALPHPPQVLVLRDSAGRPDVLMRCSEVAASAPMPVEQLDELIATEEETTVSGDAPSD